MLRCLASCGGVCIDLQTALASTYRDYCDTQPVDTTKKITDFLSFLSLISAFGESFKPRKAFVKANIMPRHFLTMSKHNAPTFSDDECYSPEPLQIPYMVTTDIMQFKSVDRFSDMLQENY
jgi:uncharacterized protein YcsI (UPF0317 family)